MAKKKKDQNMEKADFCPEIQKVLDTELKKGNAIQQAPYVANWPQEGSVFGALGNDLKTKNFLPKEIEYSVCNDIRYGWYDECYCTIHKHLLVAGKARRGK